MPTKLNHASEENIAKMDKDHILLLQKIDRLGKGMYGKVYAARNPENGEEFAIKRNYVSKEYLGTCGSFRELDHLLAVRGHPYCIQLKTYYYASPFEGAISPCKDVNQEADKLHFGFEKGQSNAIHWIKNSPLIMDKKLFMLHVLLALEFLSSIGLTHRDVKPENIIVFNGTQGSKVFKLADFGFANYVNKLEKTQMSIVTPEYRAPEICLHKHHDSKVDIWSAACMFFEVWSSQNSRLHVDIQDSIILETLFGKFPFSESDLVLAKKMYPKVYFNTKPIEAQIGNLLGWIESDVIAINQSAHNNNSVKGDNAINLIDLLNHMFVTDPSRRYSASQCLNHTFFDAYRGIINQVRAGSSISSTGVWLSKPEPRLRISNDPLRSTVMEYFRHVYDNRILYNFWYTHQNWFHALDLYDSSNIQINDSDEAYILAMSCIYLSCKYFRILKHDVCLDIMHIQHKNEMPITVFRDRVQEMESYLLQDTIDHFYNETVYELLDLDDWNTVVDMMLEGHFSEGASLYDVVEQIQMHVITKTPNLSPGVINNNTYL